MKQLALPAYSFSLKSDKGTELIFDDIRKKWIVLTPEEWVRQHFIRYLIDHKAYPASLIGVEVTFKVNSLTRRADILVYNRLGNPVLIVECKAPSVKIDNKVFDQVVAYNFRFRLPYIVVTNGLKHFACSISSDTSPDYTFLKSIPAYNELQPIQ